MGLRKPTAPPIYPFRVVREAATPVASTPDGNPPRSPLRFIELFAGIGLVRKALASAGWRCVFANDNDPEKAEVYTRNFGEEGFFLGDIRSLRGEELPDAELLTASFPCQDLSLAGPRAGLEGERSGLVAEALRVLREKNRSGAKGVDLVLLENVEGFVTSRKGLDILGVLRELNRLGYGADVLLIDASYFVPQSRRRVFVLGRRGAPATPPPSDPFAHPFRPAKVRKLFAENPGLAWYFFRLPDAPARRDTTLEQVLEDRLPDGAWFPKERAEKELARLKGRSRERLLEASRRAEEEGRPVRLTGYRRTRGKEVVLELRSDGLAVCLRVPTGGSSRQLVVEVRPDGEVGVRYMTPKEYARLQGVWGDFWVPEDPRKALKGFGDAVVVQVLEWLGRVLAEEIALAHRGAEERGSAPEKGKPARGGG